MTAQNNDWITIAEAGDYLRVTRATLYRWARDGRLKLYRLGARGTRLRRSEVDALLSPKPREPRVTVVGSSKSEVYSIGSGMRKVGDAVARFTQSPDSCSVFVNQELCLQLEVPLSPGDVLVILPKGVERKQWPHSESPDERQEWLKLAEQAFAKDWDNDKDAVYDKWKELYGIRDR